LQQEFNTNSDKIAKDTAALQQDFNANNEKIADDTTTLVTDSTIASLDLFYANESAADFANEMVQDANEQGVELALLDDLINAKNSTAS